MQPNNQPIPLINDLGGQLEKNLMDIWGDKKFDPKSYSSLPLFRKNPNLIKIPKKVKRTLERYVPKKLLREIHADEQIAIELCLLFLSPFCSTYFDMRGHPDDVMMSGGWKALRSDILVKNFDFRSIKYKKIIETLCSSTDTGPILERDKFYVPGKKCYNYRLGAAYLAKGVEQYILKTEVARKLYRRNNLSRLLATSDNIIAKNLFHVYSHIQLPTKEEILKEAKRLVEIGFKTKKGKLLTFLNKHSRTYFKDDIKRSFVEDAIEVYTYLTDNGLMIPSVGGKHTGGRVVDSFTLMPSWIRNMCKINGQRIVEVDYSALHPNICCTIYGGTMKHITHQKIAEEAGIPKDSVKNEHLSFFNKMWSDMVYSPLYDYYFQKEPTMMTNIYYDKAESEHGHKVTSRKLFKTEVEIMTDVIGRLNTRGVYVGYVYDALFCKPGDEEIVKAVMDEVALLHGVHTTAKISEIKQLES